jgi:hypothetical protein
VVCGSVGAEADRVQYQDFLKLSNAKWLDFSEPLSALQNFSKIRYSSRAVLW